MISKALCLLKIILEQSSLSRGKRTERGGGDIEKNVPNETFSWHFLLYVSNIIYLLYILCFLHILFSLYIKSFYGNKHIIYQFNFVIL